jgi:dTDP-4-dehydrorhamnose 3,5-epimerase
MVIEPQIISDGRGFFMETWHAAKFAKSGIKVVFVQDNHSRSARGTLRGLHYQIRQPQGKLIRVVLGEIFDVAVDLRRKSPTFGRWAGAMLSADNKHQMWVPVGFAHGFYVTSEVAEIIYKCTDLYAPQHERAIRWDDPDIAIDWPLASGGGPVLSSKDKAGVAYKDAEYFE